MHVNYTGKLAAALLISLTLAASCAASSPIEESTGNNSQKSVTEPAVDAAASVAIEPTPNPCAGANPCAAVSADSGVSVAVDESPAETQAIQYFVDGNGLAIRGTDPVAYFTQGGPVAGRAEFTHTWNNATWQFASAENRDLFAANPEQYAPQYGGYCAWAVSQGYTAAIDPSAWRIVDGKLYLNFNRGVQRRWERDIPGNISKANANWPGVLSDS